MQTNLVAFVEVSNLKGYKHMVPPPLIGEKIIKKRQNNAYHFFANVTKIQSILSACYVTIIGGMVDKSSVIALINLRTLINVPTLTV